MASVPPHSSRFAADLALAYSLVDRGAFRRAHDLLLPYLTQPMPDPQRMHMFRVLGESSLHLDRVTAAIEHLDEALDLAVRLEDYPSCVDLSLLNAPIHHEHQSLASAAAYYRLGLDALRTGAPDPAIELKLLTKLGTMYFYTGRYQDARRALRQARNVSSPAPDSLLLHASAEWTTALLDRWRGRHYEALRHAEAALSIYARAGSPSELARLQTVLAWIEMDLAEPPVRYESPDTQDVMLDRAGKHATLAVRYARAAIVGADESALGLAQLSIARLNRMTGLGGESIPMIQDVIALADRVGDRVLLGQAFTALADELMARGRRSSALTIYRQALAELRKTDAEAYAVWAERPLLRASEMTSGD